MSARQIDPEVQVIRDLLASRPRPAELAERRRRLDALGGSYPLPADIRVEPTRANGVPAESTEAPGADASRALLYLHGGGYVAGSLDSHRPMVAEAGRQAGVRTLALGYRLAPEHPFPAAVDDARRRLPAPAGDRSRRAASPSAATGAPAAGWPRRRCWHCADQGLGLPMPGCGLVLVPLGRSRESASASMASKAATTTRWCRSPYLLEIAAMYHGASRGARAAGLAALRRPARYCRRCWSDRLGGDAAG